MFDKKIKDFIREVGSEDSIEGCAYKYIDDELAVVFGMSDDGFLCAKIAANWDDLQCDYDYDWAMPMNLDGDVIDTEFVFYREKSLEDELNDAINTLENYYNYLQ